MGWTGAQCAFAVETLFFLSGEPVINAQRAFVKRLKKKNNTTSGWKFYPEEFHSHKTWNKQEKFSVYRLQIHKS